jgi:cytosine permease
MDDLTDKDGGRPRMAQGVRGAGDLLTAANDYELQRVPLSARVGLFSTFAVLMVWILNPAPAITGGVVGGGLGLVPGLLAIIIGALIVGAVSGPVAFAAAREGLTTALLSRIAFGVRGADAVAVFLSVVNLIFFGVVVGFLSATTEGLLGLATDSLLIPGGVFYAALMGAIAWFGFQGQRFLSNLLLIPFFLLFGLAALLAVNNGGGFGAVAGRVPTEPIGFTDGITATIGIFVVGSVLAGDITRFARDGRRGFLSAFLAFGPGLAVFVGLGAIAGAAVGSGDLVTILKGVGLLAIAAPLLLLSSWNAGDNNIYSASLAFSKLFRQPKSSFIIITTIAGAVIAAAGIYRNLLPYLGFVAITFPPVGGIMVVDYFLVRRRHEVADPMGSPVQVERYNWLALAAWALAVLFDWITATQLRIGVSGLNGILAGGIIYWVLATVFAARERQWAEAIS